MALPSAEIRLAGITLGLGKQAVCVVALHVPDLVGSFRKTVLRPLKSPPRSARVGRVCNAVAVNWRMYFHSTPPKKKNLSLMIGPPKLKTILLKCSGGGGTYYFTVVS